MFCAGERQPAACLGRIKIFRRFIPYGISDVKEECAGQRAGEASRAGQGRSQPDAAFVVREEHRGRKVFFFPMYARSSPFAQGIFGWVQPVLRWRAQLPPPQDPPTLPFGWERGGEEQEDPQPPC